MTEKMPHDHPEKTSKLSDFRRQLGKTDKQRVLEESFGEQMAGEKLPADDSLSLRNQDKGVKVVHLPDLFGETAADERARLAAEEQCDD